LSDIGPKLSERCGSMITAQFICYSPLPIYFILNCLRVLKKVKKMHINMHFLFK
jgi:hypothetical protein